MKYFILLFTTLFIFSCGKGKVVMLPEISHSEITEIKDVSAAYIFYDETKPDSTELNRKNLISTTNWLVNVDKRLTLKQVIPHIKFLQEKKGNSSHKNVDAKDYYTCNDTSRKSLGFVEFTSINYNTESPKIIFSDISDLKHSGNIHSINFGVNEDVSIFLGYSNKKTNKSSIKSEIKKLDTVTGRLILNFHENLKFQDYITYKSLLSNIDLDYLSISNQEFIY